MSALCPGYCGLSYLCKVLAVSTVLLNEPHSGRRCSPFHCAGRRSTSICRAMEDCQTEHAPDAEVSHRLKLSQVIWQLPPLPPLT